MHRRPRLIKTSSKPSLTGIIPLILAALSINVSAETVANLCDKIGNTLGSVSVAQCNQQEFVDTRGRSVKQYPLVIKEYAPVEGRQPLGKVLIMGGIHGDEYSSVSLMFRWLEKLNQHHSGLFHWQVVPLMNPDGLLQKPKATRQNSNGVDLNRNFPTPDWYDLALSYWKDRTYKNPRRYPGPMANSEPETRWFIERIKSFQPDAIVAVHAPHHLVDFDGPHNPPIKLGKLQLRRLGTYPGSLGNYGGSALEIPVVTVELSSAGIMPSDREISRMWVDLVRWLRSEVPKQRSAVLEKQKNAIAPVASHP
ncbi:MAG: peptidase M14 [Cellvibrionaceae bacterium]|nr:peptidase M14 [Cellvibrionaceae bacterium]|tara:strand:- start:3726 stop:4652 length:927 start_codon:yes stop_codon:yes gene_type:complete